MLRPLTFYGIRFTWWVLREQIIRWNKRLRANKRLNLGCYLLWYQFSSLCGAIQFTVIETRISSNRLSYAVIAKSQLHPCFSRSRILDSRVIWQILLTVWILSSILRGGIVSSCTPFGERKTNREESHQCHNGFENDMKVFERKGNVTVGLMGSWFL